MLCAAGAACSETSGLKTNDQALHWNVDGISPSSGPLTGGTAVTISGRNFPTSVESVLIGTRRLADLMVVSASQIAGTTPAGAAKGAADITVYTTTAGSSRCAGCFRYFAFARYAVTFLGSDFDSSRAVDINDSGTVVGQVWSAATGWRGRLWPSGGSATDLGTLVPVAVNSAGTVVANSASGPVLWETGQARALGGLGVPGAPCVHGDSLCVYWATDINDRRQVALGWCSRPNCPYVGGGPAFLWQSDTLTMLPSPSSPGTGAPPNGLCELGRMNNRGEVTGTGCWGKAVVLSPTSVRYLTSDGRYSSAWAVNDSGVAIGAAESTVEEWTGFAWPLGVLWFTPADINDSAQIVGSLAWAPFIGDTLFRSDGMLWQDSVWVTLGSVVTDSTWQVWRAVAINNRGQIAGFGVNTATGARGLIRLDPVATPSGSAPAPHHSR